MNFYESDQNRSHLVCIYGHEESRTCLELARLVGPSSCHGEKRRPRVMRDEGCRGVVLLVVFVAGAVVVSHSGMSYRGCHELFVLLLFSRFTDTLLLVVAGSQRNPVYPTYVVHLG